MYPHLKLELLSCSERQELTRKLSVLAAWKEKRRCQSSLAEFVRAAWPVLEPGRALDWNWHIDVLCTQLERFRRREIRRLIGNIPPRCMKSLLFGVFYPAWVWTEEPGHQFLSLSHNEDLALRDSQKMRVLVMSPWYRGHWGNKVELSGDQNTKGFYTNTAGGHRNAVGFSGGLTGKGGDTVLIDDPHDAEKAQSEAERQSVLDTYDHSVVTRLNDPAKSGIAVIMQRLHEQDLVGHVLAKNGPSIPWHQVILPMEYEGPGVVKEDPRTEIGALLWPSRYPEAEVKALKQDLGEYATSGQLQQRPSPAGGGILKAKWWREWPGGKPLPECEHVFESWDTAYTEDDLETNSYSARTEWGIFWLESVQAYACILLEAWHGRVDYPDLRRHAKAVEKERAPDRHLIEKKASGQSLIQDLRRAGVRVYRYLPDRDKIARAYAVQAVLEAGLVWYPKRKWAETVIGACASFPNGAPPSSDYTDTCTQAWLYLRQRWWLVHPADEDDQADEERRMRELKKRRLYG